MTVCGECGGTVIEYDAAAGNGFCVGCGTVVEENTIVSEVVFGESSSGAAIVQGSFVSQGATRARMSGPYGNRNTSESREQTIENASRKIRNVATVMRLSEVVQTAAVRLYTLALEHKFTKGRRNMNVVAVCLYVACRQKETRNYMLIDFSDLLQVNVFELGHIFLQLVQTLNLRLPLVDPSHYISRFAALLEFGDDTPKVAADAVRLVARFNRDWLSRGRRPAGICGACLLLAARMNNFRRSVQEIVQVVKITETTLKRRLDEFRKTPTAMLTVADFRTVWLEDEMDPPAYIRGKEKEAKEKVRTAGNETELNEGEMTEDDARKKRRRKKKKREKKRRRVDEDEEDTAVGTEKDETTESAPLGAPIDPQLVNEGILAGSVEAPLFLPEGGEATQETSTSSTLQPHESSANDESETVAEPNPVEDAIEAALREEVNEFLLEPQTIRLADALEEAEQRRQSLLTGDDELLDLDDAELDAFILSEEEVKVKERVWVEMNLDYLEALATKEAAKVGGEETRARKRRKTVSKPRDASTPAGSTAIESVQSMVKKSTKYSRKINYEALQNLFASDTNVSGLVPPAEVDLDEKEDYMYTFDDKSDGENMTVVVEEGGGGVGVAAKASSPKGDTLLKGLQAVSEPEGEEDGEGEEIELSEKGDDEYAWDEEYQQEV
ncbi:BRF1 [Sanghuangporus vaninii]